MLRGLKPAAGSTLVEMVIAVLLLAMAASTMAATLLQSSSQNGRLRRKEQGALVANELVQALKNYVTDDHSAATLDMAPAQCWDFRKSGFCPATWALNPGAHDVTFLLSGSPLGDPRYGASLTYDVSYVGGLPDAKVQLQWREP